MRRNAFTSCRFEFLFFSLSPTGIPFPLKKYKKYTDIFMNVLFVFNYWVCVARFDFDHEPTHCLYSKSPPSVRSGSFALVLQPIICSCPIRHFVSLLYAYIIIPIQNVLWNSNYKTGELCLRVVSHDQKKNQREKKTFFLRLIETMTASKQKTATMGIFFSLFFVLKWISSGVW